MIPFQSCQVIMAKFRRTNNPKSAAFKFATFMFVENFLKIMSPTNNCYVLGLKVLWPSYCQEFAKKR